MFASEEDAEVFRAAFDGGACILRRRAAASIGQRREKRDVSSQEGLSRRAAPHSGRLISPRLFRVDVQDVKRGLGFVHDLHPPIVFGLKSTVQTLKNLTSRFRRFLPGDVLVRKLFTHVVELGAFMVHMEEIAGHGR